MQPRQKLHELVKRECSARDRWELRNRGSAAEERSSHGR